MELKKDEHMRTNHVWAELKPIYPILSDGEHLQIGMHQNGPEQRVQP
jgi:hypothetical protein